MCKHGDHWSLNQRFKITVPQKVKHFISARSEIRKKRNWDFATNLSFLNTIYLFNMDAWFKPLIFQTWTIRSHRIHNLKYLSSTTSGCKDIGITKFEFVTKTQFCFFPKKILNDFLFWKYWNFEFLKYSIFMRRTISWAKVANKIKQKS